MWKVLKKLTKNHPVIFLLLLVVLLVVLTLGTNIFSPSNELFLTNDELRRKVKNSNKKVNELEDQVEEIQKNITSHYHETKHELKTHDVKTR